MNLIVKAGVWNTRWKMGLLIFSLGVFNFSLKSQNRIGYPLPEVANINRSSINKRLKACLKLDPAGNVWIAFTGKKINNQIIVSDIGLSKFDGEKWIIYNESNSPLPTNYLSDIEFQDSTIWIATKAGLVKKYGNSWTIFNQSNSSIISDSLNDIVINNESIWIATNKGVSCFSKNAFTNYTISSGLISNRVNCIENGTNGDLYFGTDKGISVLNTITGKWKSFNQSNSVLKKEFIHTLKKDSYNNIWIGTDSSVVDTYYYYPSIYMMKDDNIQSITEILDDCNINIRYLPKSLYSFATQNGKVSFVSHTNNAYTNNDILVYQNHSIKGYCIVPPDQNYKNPVEGFLMAFDSIGNLWYVGKDGIMGGDSLYKLLIQNYIPPEKSNPVSYLSINKVSAPMLVGGDMFWDLNDGRYEVPKNTCKKALFASSVWMGGVTNGIKKIAAQTYRQSGIDYWGGPITIGYAANEDENLKKFNRHWNLNRYYIQEFKQNYAKGNVTNGSYIVPADIMDWPAMGDVSKGYAKYLAPFVDVDGDGDYNPMRGDYPDIKGDQMVYWIFNDKTNIHSQTEAMPLGVEVHASAYAFNCDKLTDQDSNTAINYTTFYHFKIFNRSTEDIDSFKVALWVATELGNYMDDYVGCNPKEDYAYSYNADDFDQGTEGYGYNPPALGTVILKGLFDSLSNTNKGMSNYIIYNNDPTLQGRPNRPADYWNYMNSRWRDNSPLVYSGNGTIGNDTTLYMYPGMDDIKGRPEWSEKTNNNLPGSRNYVQSTGPIKLKSGASTTFDYAVVYSRAEDGGAQASLKKLNTDVLKVKKWFNSQTFPSCFDITKNSIIESAPKSETFMVYPNPSNNWLNVKTNHVLSWDKASFEIINLMGKSLLTGDLIENQAINIELLPPGIYFIRVRVSQQDFITRFVKN